jgi:hypothetical protein
MARPMKSRSLASLGMTIVLASAARAQTSDVALGIEALARRDVNAAEAAFRRGTTADNALIRPAAWQWLGHVAWKFRGDATTARRYLDRALSEARDSSQTMLELARLQGFSGRYRDGVQTAVDAMRRSGDGERRGIALRTAVDLVVDRAFAAGPGRMKDSVDVAVTAELRDSMMARVKRFPGRTSDALALIRTAAIMSDDAAMKEGSRSYLALVHDGVREKNARTFNGGLPGRLGFLRLFEEFALAIEIRRTSPMQRFEDDAEDWMRYGRFLRDTRRDMEMVYRTELAGTARVGALQRATNSRGRELWQELQWDGPVPAFYPAALVRELARRSYRAVIGIEKSRGVDELYFAHRLGSYSVNGAPVVVLDGTVASGIDDWLLDGTGGRAGWVANDTVYMRRTAFTETPFRALLALTDPQTIPGELFRIARDGVGDIDRAKRDSLGYFPGVAARVFRAGAQALLDSVKTPEAFTRAMFDNLTHTSIDLHESRHRADLRAGRATTEAEAEFRAKLDEVTGAALPRLALTAILSPTIGDRSPHGQANRRIMIGLNRWIRRNGASIAGYDARVPALLQLPLLTDAQLKAAFTSMRTR